MPFSFDDLQIGDEMPSLTAEPISETQLVRYAGAAGDFNPIHTVHHVAVAAGFDGVIVHGMLVMGLVGRAITAWVGIAPLCQFGVRFTGATKPGQIITVTGKVVEKFYAGSEQRVRCEVMAVDQEGQPKAQGSFTVALSLRSTLAD
jgi:acyl dehydratase